MHSFPTLQSDIVQMFYVSNLSYSGISFSLYFLQAFKIVLKKVTDFLLLSLCMHHYTSKRFLACVSYLAMRLSQREIWISHQPK